MILENKYYQVKIFSVGKELKTALELYSEETIYNVISKKANLQDRCLQNCFLSESLEKNCGDSLRNSMVKFLSLFHFFHIKYFNTNNKNYYTILTLLNSILQLHLDSNT